ncbi:MAG: serine hydrolase [Betaproteobacteria bacterium]|nr:serine hydrolase [Betaproteobacteria bacterium]
MTCKLRRTLRLAAPALLCASLLIGATLPAGAIATDADIEKVLADRVDVAKKNVGIVVGIVDDSGSRVIRHGSAGNGKPLDGDSEFEIGSISKVFTALVLADMIERGEVQLDDPIGKYLPEDIKAPERTGKAITLRHLATHTSGLPRLPTNFAPKDPTNPYVDYDAGKMLAFLGGYSLTRDPGERYEYSNYGVGLLGYLLARRAGSDYATLIRTRILQPLEMNDTAVVLNTAQRARLVQGHDSNGKIVPGWDFDALAGAGAIRSTANDMLKFMAAQRGKKKSPLQAAMARSQRELQDIGGPERQIGLGWHINWQFGNRFVWHNGGTGGFRSFAGLTVEGGVVVLSNQQTSVDDIGYHLLDERAALTKYDAPRVRTAVKIDPAVLDSYAGQYQLAPDFVISFQHEGEKFMTQATRQPKFEVFAESETEFFLQAVDAQITFVRNAYGKPTHIVLHQGGRDIEARRIGEFAVPIDKTARRKLAPASLARYADELENRGYANARRVYDEFQIEPDFRFNEFAVNGWGVALLRDFRADGLELLNLNASLNPRSVTAQESLGYAYRIGGDNDTALRYYRRALDIDPGLASATRAIDMLQRKVVTLDAAPLQSCVGEYEVATNVNISITVREGKLFMRNEAQPPVEFTAESERVFFATTLLAQLTFFNDAAGKITHLVLNQGGRDTKAVRLF